MNLRNLAITLLLAAGCLSEAKLKVITTLPDAASIVLAVGQDRVSVSSIVTGAKDPHRIEAKPSYMSRAAQADLYVAIGLDLEIAYEQPILEGSRNPKIQPGAKGYFRWGDCVSVREKPAGAVSRAQGDIHPYGNPHVWLDPYNGRVFALKLAERMGELDPANRGFFESNAARFARRIDVAMFGEQAVAKFGGPSLWSWDDEGRLISKLREANSEALLGGWMAQMRPLWRSGIVTYHKSWVYFAYRFGLKVVAELEPKPGLDPTPGHMAAVIRAIGSQKVRVILQEPLYSTRPGNFVAERTAAKVVVVPGSVGHDSTVKDYIGLFDTIIARIVAAVGH
jgi:zinc/manganese transport system substrate-binding protein